MDDRYMSGSSRDFSMSAGSAGTLLLVGAAIGAGLALLYAPRSGRETRQQLSDSADRLRRRATDAYDTVSTQARRTAERARNVAEDVRNRGQYVMDRAKSAYRDTRSEVSSMASEMAEEAGFNG
jgi:gas vesicle protein